MFQLILIGLACSILANFLFRPFSLKPKKKSKLLDKLQEYEDLANIVKDVDVKKYEAYKAKIDKINKIIGEKDE